MKEESGLFKENISKDVPTIVNERNSGPIYTKKQNDVSGKVKQASSRDCQGNNKEGCRFVADFDIMETKGKFYQGMRAMVKACKNILE